MLLVLGGEEKAGVRGKKPLGAHMTPSPAFRPKFQALNLILADHRNEIIFLDLNKNIILVGFQEKKFQVLIN